MPGNTGERLVVAEHDQQMNTLTQQVKDHPNGEPPAPPPDQQPV